MARPDCAVRTTTPRRHPPNFFSLLLLCPMVGLIGLSGVWPRVGHAFGQATFQCGGAEFSTTWYGRRKHERDLTFPLTTMTVDGKTYTVRFLARAVNGTFTGQSISNADEKFSLYHDQYNKIHQLTYEPGDGRLITATCTITEYR